MDSKSSDCLLSVLYVDNFDHDVTETILYEKFSVVGPIDSVRICRDANTNCSLGYGFVNFKYPSHAEIALKTMEFTKINNRPIRVMRSQVSLTFYRSSNKNPFTNIYVKNFDKNWNENKLREMFEPFGKIIRVKMITDDDKNSKGFCFVMFETIEAAQSAVRALNNKTLEDGNVLYVDEAYEKENNKKECDIYVKNLDCTVDDEVLHREFSIFGTITFAKVMTSEYGNTTKRFGYICYDSLFGAYRAVTKMNGKIIGSKQIDVTIAHQLNNRREMCPLWAWTYSERSNNQIENRINSNGRRRYCC